MSDLRDNHVWQAYQQLCAIRRQPEYGWRFWLLRQKPRHERHNIQYTRLLHLCQEHPQQVYDCLFSDQVDTSAKAELMWFGRPHHGLASKEFGNASWQPFIDQIKLRREELPLELQSDLRWHERVHGW